jgi:hypothetical protein
LQAKVLVAVAVEAVLDMMAAIELVSGLRMKGFEEKEH